jgi:hypothetical protein
MCISCTLAGRIRQHSTPKQAEGSASGGGGGTSYYDSLLKIDADVDMLFPVTETARRRMLRRLRSEDARQAASMDGGGGAVGGSPKRLTFPESVKHTEGDTGIVSSREAQVEGGSEDEGSAIESLTSAYTGEVVWLKSSVASGVPVVDVEPTVDVDEREEFNDMNFWRLDTSDNVEC